MNFRFKYADKSQMNSLLPLLFDLLWDNMSVITPSGKSRDEEFEGWFAEVSPAMQKDPRQIVLMLDGDDIAGYFQYYTTSDKLMMEEIQFRAKYHGSGLFGTFYSWLVRQLPQSLQVVEAYADKRNIKSQSILAHLGLTAVGSEANGLLHYKGDYGNLLKRYHDPAEINIID